MLGSGSVATGGAFGAEMAKVVPGDHICVPFVNDEMLLETLAFYAAGGLARNERVMLVGMPAMKEPLSQKLSGLVGAHPPQEQLVWVAQEELYGGSVARTPEAIWDDLRQQSRLARGQGFTGLRATGAPPTAAEAEPLLAYEDGLDEVSKQEGATVLCLYCKRQTPARLLRAVLKVHSHVWLQDRYFENLYFTPGVHRNSGSRTDLQHLDWTLNRILRSRDHESDVAPGSHSDASKQGELRRLALSLVRGLDHRDRLLAMVARQVRGVFAQLATLPAFPKTDDAREAAERLAHLTSRLDAIAALVAQPMDAAPRTHDLVVLVETQIENLRHHLVANAGPITIHAEEPVMGRFDEKLISQTLQELIRFALRHSCDGPIELHVERQGPSARITIRYQGLDGAGAAAALSGRQAHHELYDWLGIDLFFARETLRRMEGSLTVASWPDDTVLLSVDLPRNTLPSSAAQPA